jgi:hypothetical protein
VGDSDDVIRPRLHPKPLDELSQRLALL